MTVRSIKVWHTDTLEVIWQFEGGEEFREYMVVPPKAVRDAKNEAGQVVDRTQENKAGQKM
jgi:hypothetical protein